MSQQKIRFNDAELSLIKNTFANNEELIPFLRRVFLHAPMTEKEIAKVQFIADNPDLVSLFQKTFSPTIELDAPLHQIVDLWISVDMKDKNVEEALLAIKVRKTLKELIDLGLKRLAKPTKKGLAEILDYEPNFSADAETIYIDTMARNALITHIEFQISQLYILAGQQGETLEQLKARLEKNSSK